MEQSMIRKSLFVTAAAGIVAAFGSLAVAQAQKDSGAGHEMQLPPGWTEADMQACMIAGTPGEQHAYLAEGVGTWYGKAKMWMAPGAEAMEMDVTNTITSTMDGRYVTCEVESEMPGMGPFHGNGVYGFDNTTQKFVSTWIDNHSTGIMTGTGALSADHKTMTWTYNYTCPVTKKPTTMREVETATGDNTRTFEMFGIDPKSGKEFKVMHVEYTRRG
jgi:hypothetical protein